jgi:hypothetical protein
MALLHCDLACSDNGDNSYQVVTPAKSRKRLFSTMLHAGRDGTRDENESDPEKGIEENQQVEETTHQLRINSVIEESAEKVRKLLFSTRFHKCCNTAREQSGCDPVKVIKESQQVEEFTQKQMINLAIEESAGKVRKLLFSTMLHECKEAARVQKECDPLKAIEEYQRALETSHQPMTKLAIEERTTKARKRLFSMVLDDCRDASREQIECDPVKVIEETSQQQMMNLVIEECVGTNTAGLPQEVEEERQGDLKWNMQGLPCKSGTIKLEQKQMRSYVIDESEGLERPDESEEMHEDGRKPELEWRAVVSRGFAAPIHRQKWVRAKRKEPDKLAPNGPRY